jgi:hypothetical protein
MNEIVLGSMVCFTCRRLGDLLVARNPDWCPTGPLRCPINDIPPIVASRLPTGVTATPTFAFPQPAVDRITCGLCRVTVTGEGAGE